MASTFHFDWFTLRPAVLDDFLLATRWTAEDPYHRDSMLREFWLQESETKQSFLLVDPFGPVFFFKMEMVPRGERWELEIYIQFAPVDEVSRRRTMRGLMCGLAWLEKRVSGSGFEALYSTSKNPLLIAFCTKRLGAVVEDGRLKWRVNDGGKVDPKSGSEDEAQRDRGQVWKGDAGEDRGGEEKRRHPGEASGIRGKYEENCEEARA